MPHWKLTKEQIQKKLKNLHRRLKQLETMKKQGKVFWCHVESENYDRQAKAWFYEKRAIENKIFDFEERLKHGKYKKA